MRKVLTMLLSVCMMGCVCIGCADKEPYNETHANTVWSDDLPVLKFAQAAEKVDWINTQSMNNDAKLMLSSLKAVVNSVEPRIYTLEMEGSANWLYDMGYTDEDLTEYTDAFELAAKYRDELSGAVIYDPQVPDTINLASSFAGAEGKTLVCSPIVYAVLESNGIKLDIVQDFRGMFTGKYEVYDWLYNNLWNKLSHKVIACLNYEAPGYVRDYAIAAKAAIFWMSTSNESDVTVLRKFFTDMTAGESAFMGWFPEGDETSFVSLCSEYGILTYPSDWCENLTFMSGASTPTAAALAPVPATVENKVYVSMIVSDGDNLQYHQHAMRDWWDLHNQDPEFPLSWTFNPSAYVMQPAVMNYYFANAGDYNAFLTGPSGLTYNYPRSWRNASAREKLFALTNKYCKLSGITVVNNWMASAGGYAPLTSDEQNAFGTYYTDLLAVYDQVRLAGGAANNKGLLIDALGVNYSQVGDGTGAMIGAIAEALDGDKNTPRFITLQGNPWDGKMYSNFTDIYNTFKDAEEVEFVRIDTLAMLQRLSMGMTATRG